MRQEGIKINHERSQLGERLDTLPHMVACKGESPQSPNWEQGRCYVNDSKGYASQGLRPSEPWIFPSSPVQFPAHDGSLC